MSPPASTSAFLIGVAAVILASVLSSIGWILEGEAIARLSPLAVACVSHILGAGFLVVFARMRGGLPSASKLRPLAGRLIVFGIVRNAICTLMFATCLTLTSSAKVMFLTKIEPYLILLVDWIVYRQKVSRTQILILAIHILGAILLSTSGRIELSGAVLGDAMLLAGITINAFFYRPAQRLTAEIGPLWASGLSQLCGGLFLLPFMLLFARHELSFEGDLEVGWGFVIATVLVFYVASTTLWFFSLKSVPAWINSALRCVGPVVAAPIAWIAFGERLTDIQLTGAFLVVATSIAMISVERSSARRIAKLAPLEN